MVSKKKRPPPAVSSNDVSVKKIKVEDAGTSNKTEVISHKKKKAPRTREEDILPNESIINEDIEDAPENDSNNGSLAFLEFAQWSEEDLLELLKRMESNIPHKDSFRYSSRAERLDWVKISFGGHSPDDCKETWMKIQARVRRFRLLKELIDDARVWVSQPWTHFYRSQKQNRHPDLPRRPLSTYMLFYLDNKDNVASENPGLDMTAVSKCIAKMYKTLPPKMKLKYTEMAAVERKEYDEKLDQFYQDHPEMLPKPTKTSKTPGSGPRKPRPPFKLFFEDRLERYGNDPDFDKTTFLENCKEMWRTMSAKKKVVWINWAVEEETRYMEELKAYKSENPEFQPGIIKTVLTKEEKTLKERAAGKPEKPPNSGYSLFSRLMLGSDGIKDIAPKERMAKISIAWRDLPDAHRRKYQEQANHLLESYKLEYATYLESLPEDKRQEELSTNARKTRKSPNAKAAAEATEKKSPVKTSQQEQVVNSKGLFKGEPEKPPRNEFLLFMKAAGERSIKLTEKSAAKAWQSLPDSEKAKYRKKVEDMKAKYCKDFDKFLHSLSQEELKQYSALKEQAKKETAKGQQHADEDSEEEGEESDAEDNEEDDDDDEDGSKDDSSSEDSDDDNGSTKKGDNSNESGEDSDSDDSSSDSDSGDSVCDSKNSGDSSSSTDSE